MRQLATWENGIYPGLPFSEYQNIDAVNASSLRDIERSAHHWWFNREHPPPATPAMDFGTAFHTLVLEPEEFDKNYAQNPYGNWRTKEAREYRDELAAEGKTAIADNPHAENVWDSGDYTKLMRMRDAVNKHPLASRLLQGEKELTIVWEDAEHGVQCKGRIDCWNHGEQTIVDLKSSRDASYQGFMKSLRSFGYASQAAMYADGRVALVGADEAIVSNFIFVVVEKTPPYAVACYELDRHLFEQGRMEYRRLLGLLNLSMQTGHFPCYPEEIVRLTDPNKIPDLA